MNENTNIATKVEQQPKKMPAKGKKTDYFQCLVEMAKYSLAEAQLLKETISSFDEKTLAENIKKMHQLEHSCDMLKHEMTSALVKEFLPPIDREDLFELSHVTDELTDKVESVLIFFYMANITSLRDDTMSFVDLIIESCQHAVQMMNEFHNFRRSVTLKEHIIKINDLEEQGDRLYMEAVRRLSCSSESTRTIIEWRDVYRNFEACFDAAEKIADTIESAMMKNA